MSRPDARTFRQSHRKMRRRLESLDRFLHEFENRPGHEDHRSMKPCRLKEKVEKLLDACEDCYKLEERGFRNERRLREHPRAARRFDTLLAEHRRILIALKAIHASCEVYCAEQQSPGPRLQQWARGTVNRALRHEEKEVNLFQELFYQELGGLD